MSPLNKLPFTFQFSSEPHLPMRLSVGSFLLVLARSCNCAALADSEKPRGIIDIPASRCCGHVNPFTSKRILLPATPFLPPVFSRLRLSGVFHKAFASHSSL